MSALMSLHIKIKNKCDLHLYGAKNYIYMLKPALRRFLCMEKFGPSDGGDIIFI